MPGSGIRDIYVGLTPCPVDHTVNTPSSLTHPEGATQAAPGYKVWEMTVMSQVWALTLVFGRDSSRAGVFPGE